MVQAPNIDSVNMILQDLLHLKIIGAFEVLFEVLHIPKFMVSRMSLLVWVISHCYVY